MTTIAGRYEVVRALGRGSFGRTFLARDTQSGGDVALKLLDPKGDADLKAFELFEREASVLRSLRHHGIPQVHDLLTDTWEGAKATFLVMEYVDGVSIGQMIDEQRQLDPAEVLHLFLELLGILDYLHGRVPPILHRDIKPTNIIVRPDGAPVLVDFGSVRRVFHGADEAGSTVAGTYGYMPYEQYMGQASPSSDLYALGATFLHLITGRPPREFMTGEGRLAVPGSLPGDARLGTIIATLLRPSPAERYASARDVRQALLSSAIVTPVPAPAGALAPAAARTGVVRKSIVDVALLGPAPREIVGPTATLLDRVAPTAWQLSDTTAKHGDTAGFADWAFTIGFGVLTLGIIPAMFIGLAASRRRRLIRFFRHGTPGVAEVRGIRMEKGSFGEKMAKVSYQFDINGVQHRDSDQVLPTTADRWEVGDRIQILYLLEGDSSDATVSDSVIVSTA